MKMLLLLQGILLGFSIAAPVGPIGLLCIRRTLEFGVGRGFVSGLGAATADAMYGMTAACGFSAAAVILLEYQGALRLLGGAYLIYLGLSTLRKAPAAKTALEIKREKLFSCYASTFMLTITNPMTIMSFAAVFAGIGIAGGDGTLNAAVLVGGIFLGSLIWWAILSAGVGMVREKFDAGKMRMINFISGLLLTTFGVYALWEFGKKIVG